MASMAQIAIIYSTFLCQLCWILLDLKKNKSTVSIFLLFYQKSQINKTNSLNDLHYQSCMRSVLWY